MSGGKRHLEVFRDGGVATIRFDTGRPRNALDPSALAAIADALTETDTDNDVGCIVLTGTEHAFAAGADIAWMHDQSVESMIDYAGGAWRRIRSIGVPIVAAVHGWALGGGCELALTCDCVVAADDAVFGLPETSLGLLPGAGGSQRLARAIGRQQTSEIILTGRTVSAQELHRLGLANRVEIPASCIESAQEIARDVAARPRQAVRLAKQAIAAAEEMPLAAALEHERRLFELAFATDARRARTEAFLSRSTREIPPTRHNTTDGL